MPVIYYQGEPGAFSERAARILFGSSITAKPEASFQRVFQQVARHPSARGVVPIENSLFGSVHENYDHLLRHSLQIVGEVKLRVRHHLMAMPGVRLRDIRSVYSHPQALGQCGIFLKSLKRVETIAYYDTAGAAKMIAQQQPSDAAAIASARAAQVYGLRILRRYIESNRHNYTRFLVIARTAKPSRGKKKTSIMFSVPNIAGALFKTLAIFALRDVNLLKIESRPLVGKPWEYLFYLDVEGSPVDRKLGHALTHLRELCGDVRVLGSYTQGKTVEG
jgi:prephenate dehydratase